MTATDRNNKGETTMMHHTQNTHWTGFAASIPGGGHIRRGIPCQDASAVMTSPRPAVIVCDGRGSARLSHFGAQGAVAAFRSQTSILEPFLVNILDAAEAKQEQWIKFCRIMYRTFMQVKYDLAEQYHEEEKEFDCTVAFAIAGKDHIGCFQVGDGSIVVRQNGRCRTVFPPEKGEFANQTHFLRPGGEETMRFQYVLLDARANSGIAVTSDGPEHLMFRLTDMTPGRIFDVFLDDLCKEELCQQDLMDYLTRREWADDPRGTDDRSLAVLARIGEEAAAPYAPEVKVEKVKAEPEAESVAVPVAEVPTSVLASVASTEDDSVQNTTPASDVPAEVCQQATDAQEKPVAEETPAAEENTPAPDVPAEVCQQVMEAQEKPVAEETPAAEETTSAEVASPEPPAVEKNPVEEAASQTASSEAGAPEADSSATVSCSKEKTTPEWAPACKKGRCKSKRRGKK